MWIIGASISLVLVMTISLVSKNGESKKKNFSIDWGSNFRGDGIEEKGLEKKG